MMERREFLRAGAAGAMAAGWVGRESLGMAAKGGGKDWEVIAGSGPISGSFFDIIHPNIWDAAYWTEECRFWKEENWRAMMRDMRGVGMDTAICVSTASWGRPMFGGYEKTVGLPLKFGCEDPVGVCAEEAERLGMKMFFGVGFRGRVSQVRDYARMDPPWPKVWFTWNTALAEAVMERFGGRTCFAGLYIAYEVDFEEYQVELYEKLMKEYLRPAVGKDVKLLASPGVYQLGVEEVSKLPGQLERMGIDILAPQDCGGRESGMERVQKNAAVLEAIRKPLEGIGVELWCNIETFRREKGPDGRPRCIAGPMERIEKQIAMQEKLVKKLICYQYQGIMNRRTKLVNIGHESTEKLYADYAAYLRRWREQQGKGK